MTSITLQPKELGTSAILMMANGSLADFEAVIHPEATNHEASAEPPAARGRGPAAFYATACWLREAFADVCWEIEQVVTEGDLVVLHTTMCGRHVNTFVSYDETGRPAQAFPATGKCFAVTQTHWLRLRDGKVFEHWANRDDRAVRGRADRLAEAGEALLTGAAELADTMLRTISGGLRRRTHRYHSGNTKGGNPNAADAFRFVISLISRITRSNRSMTIRDASRERSRPAMAQRGRPERPAQQTMPISPVITGRIGKH